MTCPSRGRPALDAPGCEIIKSPVHAGLSLLAPEAIKKAIVDGLVAMFDGLAPREFRPNLFRFRASINRSLQATGLSEWDAYLRAREIGERADHELCLIWDNISMGEQL